MKKPVRKIDSIFPARPFQWRDRKGELHDPTEMETRHLWFTIRMIWNHTMPKPMRFAHYRQYDFNSFYNDKYMVDAVKNLLPELLNRNDLDLKWKAELDQMRKHFLNRFRFDPVENDKNEQHKLPDGSM